MKQFEGTATTSDGLSLSTQTWLPDSSPKGMLAFFHGLGEHVGRYWHVGEVLATAGYGLHMANLRGFGKSPGTRGHIMDWEEYRRDARVIMEGARQASPDAKQFFGGHSMGGLLALSMAADNPPDYDGVILSAPWLRLAFAPPGWKLWLGRQLSRMMPTLLLGNELDPMGLSRDTAVCAAYINDPLVHNRISTRLFTEIGRVQADVMARAGSIQLPILIMHGTADPIISAAGSQALYDSIEAQDKTILTYEGFYHEIFNETEKERPLRDMIKWMDEHI